MATLKVCKLTLTTIISKEANAAAKNGHRLNLLVGWDVCKEFILVLDTLWAPLLAAVAIYLAIIHYRNNRKLKLNSTFNEGI